METVKVELRNDDGIRWVSVTLSWHDSGPGNAYPNRASDLVCIVRALDAMSSEYAVENWESGVVSGIKYAFRSLGQDYRGTMIHDIRGAIGAADLSALGWAASIVVAALLQRDFSFVKTPGWRANVIRGSNDVQPVPAAGNDSLSVISLAKAP